MVYSFNPKEPKTGKLPDLMPSLCANQLLSSLLLASDSLVHNRTGSCPHLCLPSDLRTVITEELWAFQYFQKLVFFTSQCKEIEATQLDGSCVQQLFWLQQI